MQATHLGTQKRKYRVTGVTKEAVNKKTFTLETESGEKKTVTVADYFAEKYKTRLR